MKFKFILGVFLLGQFFLNAQDSTKVLNFSLDEVVVEASPLQQDASTIGKHITIIKGKQITEMPVASVDELLSYVSGVETQSRYGFGVQTDLSMRGSTFSQVLVLVDGMRLNDPLTAHFNHHIPIALSEIEQIEVLRGPAAAIYGPDAVGGVINIVSKTFSRNQTLKDGLSTSGKMMRGDHNLLSTQAGIFYKKQNFRIGVGILNNEAEGELLENPNYPNIAEDSTYNAYFKVKTASLSLGYQLKRFALKLRTAYDFRDFNAKYFYTRSTYDESVEQVEKSWNQMRLEYQGVEGSRTTLDFIYQKTQDDFIFNPLFTPNGHTTQFGQLQLNHYRNINPNLRINIGTQLDRRTIVSNDRGEHQDNHAGLYLLTAWQMNEKNHFNLNLRGDFDANYGFQFTPMLNVAHWVNTACKLRASVGRSIRAADYTERYISTNLPSLSPNRNLGNPALKTEKALNGEMGLDYFMPLQNKQNLTLKATAFGRQSNNLIDYVLTNSNDIDNNTALVADTTYFFTQNLKEVTTFGTEVELLYNYTISKDWKLRFDVGYTFLRSQNDEDILSKYISNHAKHRITSNIGLQQKYFSWSINALWKQRNEDLAEAIGAVLDPTYLVVNTQLDVNLYQQKAFATLQINNVFDIQYANILGANMPRRWWMVGIRWDL